MTKTRNPLLTTMNGLPIFRIHCERKYCAQLRGTLQKVKFYNVDMYKLPSTPLMLDALKKEGWHGVVASLGQNNNGIWSVTFKASK